MIQPLTCNYWRIYVTVTMAVISSQTVTNAVELRKIGNQVIVSIADEPFAIYDTAPQNSRPFFRDVTMPGGILVSRPISPPDGDHPHHTGIWTAVDEVNGFRFWHREGKIKNTSVHLLEPTNDPAVLLVENEWLMPNGEQLLHESTIIRIYNSRLLSYCITLTAGSQPVTFGDTEEGFFALRMAESICEKETGRVVNADELITAKGCWGKTSDWVNYSGEVDRQTVSVTLFDHPLNFRPSRYHVRDYGLFSVSPFGEGDYTKGKLAAAPVTLESKESLQLRYGIHFTSGDLDKSKVADVHQQFLQQSDKENRDQYGLQAIQIRSSADGELQPAMFQAPDKSDPVPLLVVLHTWSGDYQQRDHLPSAAWCLEQNWAYIHPHFRGKNVRPQATGSDLVVQDIIDAVRFAQERAEIDRSRIYLLGTSGGGHAALLVAGRHPEIWAGVSAWVPIVDLQVWHEQAKSAGKRYWQDIENSCGGAPGTSPNVDRQYRMRSPLFTLQHAKNVHLDINAGIRDGHDGSVPINHTLWAFNRVARPEDHLSFEEIEYFIQNAQVPAHLECELFDQSYGEKPPLFRRTSRNARVTIFDGGHESILPAALEWLSQQRRREP